MSESIYDVAIVGAGPAGIQAAIHAARRKARVLLLGRIESSALYSAHVENYAGVADIAAGKSLLETGIAQAMRFGADVSHEDALKIDQEEDGLFAVELEGGRRIASRSVIFAMGVAKKKASVPGEEEFAGKGVSYCVDCDANFYRGASVMVVGSQSAAIDGALTLLGYAEHVHLAAEELKGSDALLERLRASKVQVHLGVKLKEILGDAGGVKEVLLDNGETVRLDGVFIELGSKGALQLATRIGVRMDLEQFKHIDVSRKQETSIPGIYAAGDITGLPYQMAKAVGEGCVAGIEAAMHARRQKQG